MMKRIDTDGCAGSVGQPHQNCLATMPDFRYIGLSTRMNHDHWNLAGAEGEGVPVLDEDQAVASH